MAHGLRELYLSILKQRKIKTREKLRESDQSRRKQRRTRETRKTRKEPIIRTEKKKNVGHRTRILIFGHRTHMPGHPEGFHPNDFNEKRIFAIQINKTISLSLCHRNCFHLLENFVSWLFFTARYFSVFIKLFIIVLILSLFRLVGLVI